MAIEDKPGIYRIDVPLADSQTLFKEALITIPHPPYYGELVFNAKRRKRFPKDYTMDLIYSGSGASFNLWFTDPAVANTEVLERQDRNDEVATILAEGKAHQVRLNMGLALRTNPFIYEDFKENLLPLLLQTGYRIHKADLRFPSNNLEKPRSESYDGNGLKLITEVNRASACLNLMHLSDLPVDKIMDLTTWFACLQTTYSSPKSTITIDNNS